MLCEGRREARANTEEKERKVGEVETNLRQRERERQVRQGGGGRREVAADRPTRYRMQFVGRRSVGRCIGPCHGELGSILVWLKMGKPFG